jgi:imidazoleglycerol phosphate synthase cyclase subunit
MGPRLIPIVLLKDGFVVRSQLFSVHQKIGNVVSTIQRLNSWSVDELIVLNIGTNIKNSLAREDLHIQYDASKIDNLLNIISQNSFMPLAYGGQLRTQEDVDCCLRNGADKIVLNSAIISNEQLVTYAVRKYGAQCVIASIDAARDNKGDFDTFIENGTVRTGLSASAHAKLAEQMGVGEILINSVDEDGAGKNFDLGLLEAVSNSVELPVIGCGGAGEYEHFADAIIKGKVSAVAAANIFHFREMSYPLAKKKLIEKNIAVRPPIIQSSWLSREPKYKPNEGLERYERRIKLAREKSWVTKYSKYAPEQKWCASCLYPTKSATPTVLDQDGICMGCKMSSASIETTEAEWARRLELLRDTIIRGQEYGDGQYHCVIGVSGGKDSYFQTHVIKNILGLNPLLVTYYGNNYSDVGERNLHRMKDVFDVDHIVFSPSVVTLKKLNRLGFVLLGDMNWHNHMGIASLPMQMATKMNIPFVIWGEHGYADLCGQFSLNDFIEFTYRNRLEHFGRSFEWHYMLGLEGLTKEDMYAYQYPTDHELYRLNLRGLYLANYVRWNPQKHTSEMIEKFGFEVSDEQFERTYRTMSNLDDIHENGIHDYLKYIKFGYGRCTDHASKDVRNKQLSRGQAIDLVKQYDPIKPTDIYRWLEYVDMSMEEFDDIADTFRDPAVWGFSGNTWIKSELK